MQFKVQLIEEEVKLADGRKRMGILHPSVSTGYSMYFQTGHTVTQKCISFYALMYC